MDVASSNLAGPTNNKMAKEETKQQLNVRVKDGEQFYSNEVSINFNPNEIILDFKCITHLNELGNHRSLLLSHNPIILNPFYAKSFLLMLNKAIQEYETRFGEIKKSESMKKAEKLVKKDQKIKAENEEKEDKSDVFFG